MEVRLVLMLAFAVICALVANSRGRSPVAWFFLGLLFALLALIILLVLPDLKKEQAYRRQAEFDRRRLREQIRQERVKSEAFRRYSMGRMDAHDDALGVDTRTNGQLPNPDRSTQGPLCQIPSDDDDDMSTLQRQTEALGRMGSTGGPASDKQWYYELEGHPVGPVSKARLVQLVQEGRVNDDSLVWSEGFDEWRRLGDMKRVFQGPSGENPLEGQVS